MANKYARTVGGNWSADATWSTTSGGTADTTKPVAGDTALLDANSGQVTIDVASACAIVNCTGYTNTLTQSADMTTTGSITFVSGMTFTVSSGTWSVNGAATITTAGKAFGAFTFAGTATYTLADTLNVDGTLTVATNQVVTIATSDITASGGITLNGTASIVGTGRTITLDGTGTVSQGDTSGGITTNLTINTAGTITLGTNFNYATQTFTYTAGTVVTTGSTFNLRGACTLNTSGINWNNVNFRIGGTYVLSSALSIDGLLTIATTGVVVNTSDITCSGGMTINNLCDITGAGRKITFDGTGTISTPTAVDTGGLVIGITINTSGTITISNLRTGVEPIVYTAGTVVTTGSLLALHNSTALNTSGMSWNNITVQGGTATLSSALDANGNLTINAGTTVNCAGYQLNIAGNFTNSGTFTHGNNTTVFDGAGTSNVAGSTTFNSFQIAAGTTVNLTATQVFSVIGTFTATGTTSSQIVLKTTAGGSTAGFVVSTVGTVRYVRATDINSAAGSFVMNLRGTLSNTTNWATYATGDTYWIISTTGNDKLDQYVDGVLVASYDAR